MKKILVHLHLYYKEQADTFAQKISSALDGQDVSYDLFITTNERNGEIEQKFLSFKPDAKFIIVKNIGADIFPFITVLNLVDLNDYDYLIKLHTKKIYDNNDVYRPNCFIHVEHKFYNDYLTSFLTFENMKKILIRFERDKKLGMVAGHRIILKEKVNKWYPVKIGNVRVKWVPGTMFIARVHIFNSLKQLSLDESKFSMYKKSDVPSHYDSFLWGVEQFIGNCANAQGLKLEDVFTPKLQILYRRFVAFFKYYIRKISKFFFRIEKGTIKICKIPIVKIFEKTDLR